MFATLLLSLAGPAAMNIVPISLAKLDPVPFTQVTIRDRFWAPRQEVNRTATVEHSLKMLDKAGNYLVMKLAAEGKREGYKGLLFTDSDLYKVMEGIAYAMAAHPDPKLDQKMDELIAMIAKAQMPDGYLNTYYQVNKPDRWFTNLRDEHELYCAGHMFEAAAAHFQATGKRNFLDVALKLAERIYKELGPEGKPGYCGHPEPELALVKLWKVTGDRKWFDFAERMIELRGTHYFAKEHNTPAERYEGVYWLDDVPITEHKEIKGHAVRAAYLLSGAADVARETGDQGIVRMLQRVWRNATEKRIFVTGGIGPSASNEGFTVDYDLPNLTAYQETCATIAMALWGHRMGLLFGEAKYWDAVEMALHNGLLSGVALDGKSFFYVNPLASMGNHHRQEWFTCACCPPNVLRTIASLGGYAYATSEDSLYVNLFVGGSVSATVGGSKVAMDVKTDYPWDGKVEFTIKEPGKFKLCIRKPRWCDDPQITVGATPSSMTEHAGYLVFEADWRKGDKVSLELPMPVVQVEAHPWVKEDLGRTAVQRGPLIYCLERNDNSIPIEEIVIPRGATFKTRYRRDLLGGVVTIEADAQRVPAQEWDRRLYQPAGKGEKIKATLIPYGFWDNRRSPSPSRAQGSLAMQVWIPFAPPPARVTGPEGRAKVEVSFQSGNAQPWGVNDGLEPASSGEQPKALCHFWPHKGGEEWVQYTWAKPLTASGVKIYWFDDTGRGECRLPESWRLEAMVDGQWKPVNLKVVPITLDKWCEASFPPLTTTALRLMVKQKLGWATGIHEWKVLVEED